MKKIICITGFIIFSTCITLAAQETGDTGVSDNSAPAQNIGNLLFDGSIGLSTGFHSYADTPSSIVFSFLTMRTALYGGFMYRFAENWGVAGHVGLNFFGLEINEEIVFSAVDFPVRVGITTFNRDWRLDMFAGSYIHTFNFQYSDVSPEIGVRASYKGVGLQLSYIFSDLPVYFANKADYGSTDPSYVRLEIMFTTNPGSMD